MAIYHFSVQMISRSKGQNAVASASYRSGEKLTVYADDSIRYYRREVQPETVILAPSHAPTWVFNREMLWNRVEEAEKRVNSQVAREINVALPIELLNKEQAQLIHTFVQEQFVNQGMIADVCIHRDDVRNPHAHIMLTTREITAEGFSKKNRTWNDRTQLESWRTAWAEYANQALEKAGYQERITEQSFEKQGKEELPTIHLGHGAHALEKRGIETDRGNINREIRAYNSFLVEVREAEREVSVCKQAYLVEKKKKETVQPTRKRVVDEIRQKYGLTPNSKTVVESVKQKYRKESVDSKSSYEWVEREKASLEWNDKSNEKLAQKNMVEKEENEKLTSSSVFDSTNHVVEDKVGWNGYIDGLYVEDVAEERNFRYRISGKEAIETYCLKTQKTEVHLAVLEEEIQSVKKEMEEVYRPSYQKAVEEKDMYTEILQNYYEFTRLEKKRNERVKNSFSLFGKMNQWIHQKEYQQQEQLYQTKKEKHEQDKKRLGISNSGFSFPKKMEFLLQKVEITVQSTKQILEKFEKQLGELLFVQKVCEKVYQYAFKKREQVRDLEEKQKEQERYRKEMAMNSMQRPSMSQTNSKTMSRSPSQSYDLDM